MTDHTKPQNDLSTTILHGTGKMALKEGPKALFITLIGSFYLATLAAAADLNREFNINIPKQPLAASLTDFSRQSDVIVVASSDLTAGKFSKPVNATTTAAKALKQLLEGSKLAFTQENDGSIVVKQLLKTSMREANSALLSGASDSPSANNIENRTALEEIVVTARKRPEDLQ